MIKRCFTAVATTRHSHRLRRLAKAHPKAIASVLPPTIESTPNLNEKDIIELKKPSPKKWTKSQYSSPEFFAWINTYPEKVPVPEAGAEEGDNEEEGDVQQGSVVNVGKTFITPMARLAPYDQHIFGPFLLEGREKVLSPRTPTQLKMAHEHLRLKEANLQTLVRNEYLITPGLSTGFGIDSRASDYRSVELGWEKVAPPSGPLSGTTFEGSKLPKRRAKRGATGMATRIVYGPSETFAYVYSRMIPAYSVLHRVMTELRDDLQAFNPSRVLDFGSGPGTAALAVWDVWGAGGGHEEIDGGKQQRHEGSQLSEVRLVQESQSMIDAAKIMLKSLVDNGVKIGFGTSILEEAKAATREANAHRGDEGGKFDLVVAAYSLSCLPTHAARAAATAVMWDLVSPGGVLVVIENGSAKGSHTVRSARKMVLESAPRPAPHQSQSESASAIPEDREGGMHRSRRSSPYVVAPCRHDRECPMRAEKGDICRFTQKVPSNPSNIAGCPVGSTMFSYVSIRKGAPDPVKMATGEVDTHTSSSVDLLKAHFRLEKPDRSLSAAMTSLGTMGICDENLARQDWARLVRKPLKGHGHVLLDLCTPDGEIQRKVVAKSACKGVPGYFVSARKCQLGGLWPYLGSYDTKSTNGRARDQSVPVGQARHLQENETDGNGNADWGEKLDICFDSDEEEDEGVEEEDVMLGCDDGGGDDDDGDDDDDDDDDDGDELWKRPHGTALAQHETKRRNSDKSRDWGRSEQVKRTREQRKQRRRGIMYRR